MASRAAAQRAKTNGRTDTAHSGEDEHERKQRVLTKGRASITRSIADALVIKDGDVFFLCRRDGSVGLQGPHGFGLYYHDCRYLNGYELRFDETELDVLSATALDGFSAVIQLANPDLRMADGRLIQKEEIGLSWKRVVDGSDLALHDLLILENYGLEGVAFDLRLGFGAGFEDVYEVRGLLPAQFGKLRRPRWNGDALGFLYDGADGLYRGLTVTFAPAPATTEKTTAVFHVRLGPKERQEIAVSLAIVESSDRNEVRSGDDDRIEAGVVSREMERSVADWLGDHTAVVSRNRSLVGIMDRSLRDLRALRSSLRGKQFFAAGVPWFVTLFGRDSIVAAYEMLASEPDIAAQTLRLLASYQGQRVDAWKDEQPGKILHELRVGELARLNEIPHTPYYGTVDATPLFLILLARHAAWTGSLDLFDELRANVELALVWIADYGDGDGDGYVEYRSTSEKGLVNQGWKDSGDGIVNADGSLARPPIALVEVQGYVYAAKRAIAGLYRRAGEGERAAALEREADDLRERFNRDFWLKDDGIFALALQAKHEPCAVVSSNPGQALWTGIVDCAKAKTTVDRLLAGDMFNGWGIRTLASTERAYNPTGYHLGTVWPHDNALIAAGFRRYGFDDAFRRVLAAIGDAATHFPNYRLPEVFSGFAREEYGVPVRYPVACHPQAWAAGAVPFMLATALGLQPEAFDRRLRLVRPMLPETVDDLEVRRLRVGHGVADLRFRRGAGERVDVEIVRVDGDLDVIVDDDGEVV
jgi:glycogen debranching enzyme